MNWIALDEVDYVKYIRKWKGLHGFVWMHVPVQWRPRFLDIFIAMHRQSQLVAKDTQQSGFKESKPPHLCFHSSLSIRQEFHGVQRSPINNIFCTQGTKLTKNKECHAPIRSRLLKRRLANHCLDRRKADSEPLLQSQVSSKHCWRSYKTTGTTAPSLIPIFM